MAWTGSDVEHCSDNSEASECYARDERDLIAEESAADAKLQERFDDLGDARGRGWPMKF